MLQNPDVKNDNVRCIYENEDMIVIHSIGTFPKGTRDAVMYVGLKRDGKISAYDLINGSFSSKT